MRFFKTYLLPVLFVGLVVGIDQFTKLLAVRYLAPLREVVLIDGVFSLLYLENTGMAFGLFQGGRWVLIGITVVIMGLLIYYYVTLPKTRFIKIYKILFLMIIGGALGNFGDRLLRGFVVDFFYFSLINFPVFNMADVFLVVSVVVLIFLTIFFGDGKKSG
jgi:signal peptidase II